MMPPDSASPTPSTDSQRAAPAHRSESALLNELGSAVDEALSRALAARPLRPPMDDALRYAVLGGGKRLRPVLVLLAARACGGTDQSAEPAAVAIEFVHCFSLVHDDLPAMDDDEIRRGRPTLHIHSGEATALLAGDALLVRAFAELARSPLPGDTVRLLCGELAEATTQMIEGQMLDTVGGLDERMPAIERLKIVHGGKTGALIRTACRMGAMSAAAPAEAVDVLDAYGAAVGMLFQAVDDLIDETQTADHAGKRTGKDRERGRLTWPGSLGIEETRSAIAQMLDSAVASADRLAAMAPDPPSAAAAAALTTLARDMAMRTR